MTVCSKCRTAAYIAASLHVITCTLALTTPSRSPLTVHVQTPATNHAFLSHSPPSQSRISPLFTATENESNVGSTDAPEKKSTLIRDIDKQMDKISRQKEKAEQKMKEANDKLSDLLMKRDYLLGQQIGDIEQNFKESAVRSAVKAMMWRIIAGSVTFVTSLRFSGSVTKALEIVGSDFASKSLTMFIGERLMNKSQAGRTSGADGVGRSLAKALIWRLFAICNTLTMAFFIAKDLSVASKIAGSDAIFKTALMFVYERVWAKVEWGKEYLIEFSI